MGDECPCCESEHSEWDIEIDNIYDCDWCDDEDLCDDCTEVCDVCGETVCLECVRTMDDQDLEYYDPSKHWETTAGGNLRGATEGGYLKCTDCGSTEITGVIAGYINCLGCGKAVEEEEFGWWSCCFEADCEHICTECACPICGCNADNVSHIEQAKKLSDEMLAYSALGSRYDGLRKAEPANAAEEAPPEEEAPQWYEEKMWIDASEELYNPTSNGLTPFEIGLLESPIDVFLRKRQPLTVFDQDVIDEFGLGYRTTVGKIRKSSNGDCLIAQLTVAGLRSHKDDARLRYQVIVDFRSFPAEVPQAYVKAPSDEHIRHPNIYHARTFESVSLNFSGEFSKIDLPVGPFPSPSIYRLYKLNFFLKILKHTLMNPDPRSPVRGDPRYQMD